MRLAAVRGDEHDGERGAIELHAHRGCRSRRRVSRPTTRFANGWTDLAGRGASLAFRPPRVDALDDDEWFHQSQIAAPHVKPAPKATIATFMPRFNRPSFSASQRRSGIVAAVVLPYLWMLWR